MRGKRGETLLCADVGRCHRSGGWTQPAYRAGARRIDETCIDCLLHYLAPKTAQPRLARPPFHEERAGVAEIQTRDVLSMRKALGWQYQEVRCRVASGDLAHRNRALT